MNAYPVGAVVSASRVVPEPLGAFLLVLSTPTTKGTLGDPEDSAEVCGPCPSLEVLANDLLSEANIFLDQTDPSRGRSYLVSVQPVGCPVSAHLSQLRRTNRRTRSRESEHLKDSLPEGSPGIRRRMRHHPTREGDGGQSRHPLGGECRLGRRLSGALRVTGFGRWAITWHLPQARCVR